MEHRLDAENTERLTKSLSRLLSRREGTVVGTDGAGGGYVQDGLLGRILCRCESLHDAQDIGTLLSELPSMLADVVAARSTMECLHQELDHYGLHRTWGLDVLLRHIYNNRDATVGAWKGIADDLKTEIARLRADLERIESLSSEYFTETEDYDGLVAEIREIANATREPRTSEDK